MPNTIDLLIVGGGPAGLVAGAQAIRAGRSVRVVEASSRVGGMSASISVGGQRVDMGSHRLHPSASPQVMEVLNRLLGNDLQTRPRDGRIRLCGRWVGFPLQPVDLLKSTPPSFGVRAALDMLLTPFRKERSDTYLEVVRSGLGPTVLRDFYGPFAKKLWGVPAGELAGEVARRRISVRGPTALVKKLLSNASDAPVFLYPRLGYGQVVDALETEIEGSASGSISRNCKVEEAIEQDSHVEVRLSGGEQLCARQVFWTANPAHLGDVLETGSASPPAKATVAPAAPVHRGMVLVYLVLDTPQYTTFDAHYFPALDTKSARISEPKNYRDGPDPVTSTVLCAELACDVGGETWLAAPGLLRDWVVADLVNNDLPTPVVTGVQIERLPAVYPVHLAGYPSPGTALSGTALSGDAVVRHARIHVFGRQGLVVADNLHHVIDMALGAVGCLGADLTWDHDRWSILLSAFAKNVVED